jgi:hypothetical protein
MSTPGGTSVSRGLSRRTLFRSAGAAAAVGAVGASLPAVAAGGANGVAVGGVDGVEPLRLARVWAVTRAQQKLLVGFDDTHNVFEDGSRKTEAYVLSVTGPNGGGISRRLVVQRGQRIDLGTVVVD